MLTFMNWLEAQVIDGVAQEFKGPGTYKIALYKATEQTDKLLWAAEYEIESADHLQKVYARVMDNTPQATFADILFVHRRVDYPAS